MVAFEGLDETGNGNPGWWLRLGRSGTDVASKRGHLDASRLIRWRYSEPPPDDDLGDHAEAMEIIYDADTISYRDLLEFFLQIHDPTTLDQQADEMGRFVRSAIFYTSEGQRPTALDTIADSTISPAAQPPTGPPAAPPER